MPTWGEVEHAARDTGMSAEDEDDDPRPLHLASQVELQSIVSFSLPQVSASVKHHASYNPGYAAYIASTWILTRPKDVSKKNVWKHFQQVHHVPEVVRAFLLFDRTIINDEEFGKVLAHKENIHLCLQMHMNQHMHTLPPHDPQPLFYDPIYAWTKSAFNISTTGRQTVLDFFMGFRTKYHDPTTIKCHDAMNLLRLWTCLQLKVTIPEYDITKSLTENEELVLEHLNDADYGLEAFYKIVSFLFVINKRVVETMRPHERNYLSGRGMYDRSWFVSHLVYSDTSSLSQAIRDIQTHDTAARLEKKILTMLFDHRDKIVRMYIGGGSPFHLFASPPTPMRSPHELNILPTPSLSIYHVRSHNCLTAAWNIFMSDRSADFFHTSPFVLRPDLEYKVDARPCSHYNDLSLHDYCPHSPAYLMPVRDFDTATMLIFQNPLVLNVLEDCRLSGKLSSLAVSRLQLAAVGIFESPNRHFDQRSAKIQQCVQMITKDNVNDTCPALRHALAQDEHPAIFFEYPLLQEIVKLYNSQKSAFGFFGPIDSDDLRYYAGNFDAMLVERAMECGRRCDGSLVKVVEIRHDTIAQIPHKWVTSEAIASHLFKAQGFVAHCLFQISNTCLCGAQDTPHQIRDHTDWYVPVRDFDTAQPRFSYAFTASTRTEEQVSNRLRAGTGPALEGLSAVLQRNRTSLMLNGKVQLAGQILSSHTTMLLMYHLDIVDCELFEGTYRNQFLGVSQFLRKFFSLSESTLQPELRAFFNTSKSFDQLILVTTIAIMLHHAQNEYETDKTIALLMEILEMLKTREDFPSAHKRTIRSLFFMGYLPRKLEAAIVNSETIDALCEMAPESVPLFPEAIATNEQRLLKAVEQSEGRCIYFIRNFVIQAHLAKCTSSAPDTTLEPCALPPLVVEAALRHDFSVRRLYNRLPLSRRSDLSLTLELLRNESFKWDTLKFITHNVPQSVQEMATFAKVAVPIVGMTPAYAEVISDVTERQLYMISYVNCGGPDNDTGSTQNDHLNFMRSLLHDIYRHFVPASCAHLVKATTAGKNYYPILPAIKRPSALPLPRALLYNTPGAAVPSAALADVPNIERMSHNQLMAAERWLSGISDAAVSILTVRAHQPYSVQMKPFCERVDGLKVFFSISYSAANTSERIYAYTKLNDPDGSSLNMPQRWTEGLLKMAFTKRIAGRGFWGVIHDDVPVGKVSVKPTVAKLTTGFWPTLKLKVYDVDTKSISSMTFSCAAGRIENFCSQALLPSFVEVARWWVPESVSPKATNFVTKVNADDFHATITKAHDKSITAGRLGMAFLPHRLKLEADWHSNSFVNFESSTLTTYAQKIVEFIGKIPFQLITMYTLKLDLEGGEPEKLLSAACKELKSSLEEHSRKPKRARAQPSEGSSSKAPKSADVRVMEDSD